jgi:hypothetical protein
MMQAVDVFLCDEGLPDQEPEERWDWYGNMTGHPMITLPKKFEATDGFPLPKPQNIIGRVYDESTLLALAHACQRAIGLTQRPPLDQFLAQKDEILEGEEVLEKNKYYTD